MVPPKRYELLRQSRRRTLPFFLVEVQETRGIMDLEQDAFGSAFLL